MMTDDNNSAQPPQRTRRSSFAGQTFAELFGTGRQSVPRPDNVQNQQGQFPGPITTAAAQAQQRRLSIATLGLSGSPNSTSPYGSFRGRRESISSANSSSIDESAIEDEPASVGVKDVTSSTPVTPFARRMSFGARAMRDIRTSTGGGNSGGGSPGQYGEGFNWSENLRSRAERGSIAAPGGGGPGMPVGANNHARAKSVATMEPPVQEMPRAAPKKPDHFQERILKGDFYMD